MTNQEAQAIADAAITLKLETSALRTFEERGARLDARVARRAVSEAQAKLDAAIAAVVER